MKGLCMHHESEEHERLQSHFNGVAAGLSDMETTRCFSLRLAHGAVNVKSGQTLDKSAVHTFD